MSASSERADPRLRAQISSGRWARTKRLGGICLANALGEPKENDSKFKRGRERSKHLRCHACGLRRAWTNELTWSFSLLHPL
jgi:hypothetical protein